MLKKIAALALALSTLFTTGCGQTPITTPDDPALPDECRDNSDLAAVMARLLDDPSQNFAFSPLSLYVALAMAAEGAGGETLAQLEGLLGAPISDITSNVGTVCDRLLDVGGSTKMTIAQSVWTDNRVEFSESYLDSLGKNYRADIYSGTLSSDAIRMAINDWARDKTNGLIDPLLNYNLSSDSVLALINSLYFKARWACQFSPRTFSDTFTALDGAERTADFMTLTASLKYFDCDQVFGLCLPYDDGKTQMIVLLPKDEAALPSSVMCQMGVSQILDLADNARQQRVHLTMPAFTTESSFDLIPALRSLGVKDAFDSSLADFSNMSGQPLFLSSVIQKVKIKVDTEGTEAAAVTMAADELTAMMEEPVELTLDRPFTYLIVHQDSPMPLFMGGYNR